MTQADPIQNLLKGLSECRRWSWAVQEQVDALRPQLSQAAPGVAKDLERLAEQLRRLDADFMRSLERLEDKTDSGRWFLRQEQKDQDA
jgi:hypothetical protein